GLDVAREIELRIFPIWNGLFALKAFISPCWNNTSCELFNCVRTFLSKGAAVGIDLGTTYFCAGVFQPGRVEILDNDQSNKTTYSYVAFTDTERLIEDGLWEGHIKVDLYGF
uniref:Uncharacterized protein n=1 Tax=Haplochromis burtoni TaxID=8153 RepID=A0A3Q2W292_HAPBU